MTTKLKPSTENFYHIYNRGIDKRIIFSNSSDYIRFVQLLYICNDSEIKLKNTSRYIRDEQGLALLIKRPGEKLVDILSFSLMPNHFHLLLRQSIDNGIPVFMHKLATAYCMAFNKKYERTGRFLEGPYKRKLIDSEEYLIYLSRYIHLNPVELVEPGWKERGIKNWEKVNEFLEQYKWSSYQDYIGIKNFPSIINKRFLKEYHKTEKDYKEFTRQFLRDDLEDIEHLFL